MRRSLAITSALLIPITIAPGGDASYPAPLKPEEAEPDAPFVPIDVTRATYTFTGNMSLDRGPGSLDAHQVEMRQLLSNRLLEVGGWSLLPVATYSFTSLDFSGTAPGFAIENEDVHTFSFNQFFFRTPGGDSPWLLAGWGRASLSSDFQHLTGDAFFFDAAAIAAYRVSERFTIGAGAAVFDIGGDPSFIPSVNFDWQVSDDFRFGIYGPFFTANYDHGNDWEFGIRGEPGGGSWNIRDAAGDSRTLDFSSYRVGINANRRLHDNFWLGAMVGTTLGNQIEVRDRRGGNRFKTDLGESLFAQIVLRLRIW